jgi:hypothetical protein
MTEHETLKSWKLPDARMLTDRERQALCKMLFDALIEIRLFGWEGKAEEAANLADSFHNLPAYLWSEEFSFSLFRKFLEAYQEKYTGGKSFDYVKKLDGIMTEESE